MSAVSDSVDVEVHVSEPSFRTFHALRIKGFAKVEVVAEMADVDLAEAQAHLDALQALELAMFREVRSLWQLTAAGKEAHAKQLADDVATAAIAGRLQPFYEQFLGLNEELKDLCGQWQLRDGEPNGHTDAAYDRSVIADLAGLNDRAVPLVRSLAELLPRLGQYGDRLAQACQRVRGGETNMFTGVMCGSYHDVWMELHEDLILTQGIDRATEGSF
jgi:hypothetical protein